MLVGWFFEFHVTGDARVLFLFLLRTLLNGASSASYSVGVERLSECVVFVARDASRFTLVKLYKLWTSKVIGM